MSDNDLIIDAFTELAPNYEETVDSELRQFWGIGYREFIDQLLQRVDVLLGDIVLDAATGTGVIPENLFARCGDSARIVGLDITEAMLHFAQASIKEADAIGSVSVICGSATEIPISCNAFDVAICGLGMHHMQVPLLLQELSRVIKPDGRLTMADVAASRFWRSFVGKIFLRVMLIRYGLQFDGARAEAEMESLANIYTSEEWRKMLAKYGFRNIEITTFPALRAWYPSALIITANAR